MKKLIVIFLVYLALPCSSLQATHGAYLNSYGIKSAGMAGIGVAYPQESLVASINPAGMYWIGNRWDAGILLFSPIRKYSFTGFGGGCARSHSNYFPVPDIGYNRYLTCDSTVGVSIYGNGGLNTDYRKNNPVFGTSHKLGVDLAQAIVALTYARKLAPCRSIGVSLLLGIQRLKARGLENFKAFSSDPDDVTNRGYSYDYGIGARIGWMEQIIPKLWFGVSYSTKVYMTKLKKYEGLLADKARLHMPAIFVIGLRYELNPCMNFCFETKRIYYGDIRPYNNPIQNIFTSRLGTKSGAGFGWRNITVYKFGVDARIFPNILPCCIVRAGFSRGPVPFPSSQIDPNIVAPAVVKDHITLGASTEICGGYELDIAYMHAFRNTKRGTSVFGLGKVKLTMHQNYVAMQVGKRF